jgi:DNA-binding response OmpR family regulator
MIEQQNGPSASRYQALVIEADEAYRVVIAGCIRLAGCRVEQVAAPDLAFPAIEQQRFDLVVWGVPRHAPDRRSEVITELRLRTEAPLVLVDGSHDMAQFDLETGADQWVPKPFVPGSLVGAAHAALRKSAASVMQVATRVDIRGMVLDGKRRQLRYGGHEVTFTRQEWELLSILVSHPNRFLGAREILRMGWRAGEHGAEQLRTYVHRLRQKLEPINAPCRLLSQHGQGYCLVFA